MATTVTSLTTAASAWTTSASTTPAIAITPATGTSLARPAAFRTANACLNGGYHAVDAVEVRFVVRIEIRAAFDYCGGRSLRSAV